MMHHRLLMTLPAVMGCMLIEVQPVMGQERAEAVAAFESGTAIVRVVTEPEFAGGATFVFSGVPAGELELAADGQGTMIHEGVPGGSQVCKLSEVDPQVEAAGYRLTEIRCDDHDGADPSVGRLEDGVAVFRVEASETVTCDFVLKQQKPGLMRPGTACLCPKEGRWNAQNLEGSMKCTGAFGLNRKLKPVRDNGVILVMEEDCSQVFGDSTTKKEDDVLMTRTDDCSYTGIFDGEEEGVDMVIDVVWTMESEERIRGEMRSTTSKMGMTCVLFRPFELTFDGPLSEADYQKWEKRIRKKMGRP